MFLSRPWFAYIVMQVHLVWCKLLLFTCLLLTHSSSDTIGSILAQAMRWYFKSLLRSVRICSISLDLLKILATKTWDDYKFHRYIWQGPMNYNWVCNNWTHLVFTSTILHTSSRWWLFILRCPGLLKWHPGCVVLMWWQFGESTLKNIW